MTSLRLVCLCSLLTVGSVFSSCNESKENTDTDTIVTDSSTVTAPAAPASSIVNSPQLMMLVKHRVKDYAKWKTSYDAHDSMRLAHGMHNYVIGRSVDDANMLLVVLKADNMDQAKAFMKDPSLKAAMQKGGVTGNPTPVLANITWQDTASLTAVRSLLNINVKDWAAWQKSFDEGRSERLENGVADRVYGYEVDNQNKVMLVTAITDTAKASAYWTSDMLKNRRAASGVIGMPERFMFQIMQRY